VHSSLNLGGLVIVAADFGSESLGAVGLDVLVLVGGVFVGVLGLVLVLNLGGLRLAVLDLGSLGLLVLNLGDPRLSLASLVIVLLDLCNLGSLSLGLLYLDTLGLRVGNLVSVVVLLLSLHLSSLCDPGRSFLGLGGLGSTNETTGSVLGGRSSRNLLRRAALVKDKESVGAGGNLGSSNLVKLADRSA